MKRIMAMLVVLLVAGTAGAQALPGQVGRSPTAVSGGLEWSHNFTAALSVGVYYIGKAAPSTSIGFELGAGFVGVLYVCDENVNDPLNASDTCDAVQALSADVAQTVYRKKPNRAVFLLDITTKETGTGHSRLGLSGSYTELSEGGGGLDYVRYLAHSTTVTLTKADADGKLLGIQTAAGSGATAKMVLPEVFATTTSENLRVCFLSTDAERMRIFPHANNSIRLNDVVGSAGVGIQTTGTSTLGGADAQVCLMKGFSANWGDVAEPGTTGGIDRFEFTDGTNANTNNNRRRVCAILLQADTQPTANACAYAETQLHIEKLACTAITGTGSPNAVTVRVAEYLPTMVHPPTPSGAAVSIAAQNTLYTLTDFVTGGDNPTISAGNWLGILHNYGTGFYASLNCQITYTQEF